MSEIETLISEKEFKNRWSPIYIDNFFKDLSLGALYSLEKPIRQNLCYSLQYLQYIQLQIKELRLTEVIMKMLYKNYIITSMSIVETILYHLLRINNKLEFEEWGEEKNYDTREINENGRKKRVQITLQAELDTPKEKIITFERIIDKVRKYKFLDLNDTAFPYMKQLKNLRNKVHLHIARESQDTDYHSIGIYEYYLTRYTLYKIIKDKCFEPEHQSDSFDFIKLSPEEKKQLEHNI